MIDYVKLIEEQIKYWTRLQNEENSTHSIDMSMASAQEYCSVSGVKLDKACKHEPDGIEHAMVDDGRSFSMNRCKKCGEFYR